MVCTKLHWLCATTDLGYEFVVDDSSKVQTTFPHHKIKWLLLRSLAFSEQGRKVVAMTHSHMHHTSRTSFHHSTTAHKTDISDEELHINAPLSLKFCYFALIDDRSQQTQQIEI